MLKLLAFLTIIQLAQSTCVIGPRYWCQSVQTANECDAFNHCVQTVWSKQATYTDKKLTFQNSDNCQECVKCLYGDVRNNVKSEAICRLIGQCSASPKQQAKSDLARCSSENTCASLDMAVKCSSISKCMQEWARASKTELKQSTAELTQKELNEENACGFCVFIMTKYQNIISQNSTETDAKNYLDSACKLLPSSQLSEQVLKPLYQLYL